MQFWSQIPFALRSQGREKAIEIYFLCYVILFYFILFVSLREICILGAFVCLFAQSRMRWHAPVKGQKSSCKKSWGKAHAFVGWDLGFSWLHRAARRGIPSVVRLCYHLGGPVRTVEWLC